MPTSRVTKTKLATDCMDRKFNDLSDLDVGQSECSTAISSDTDEAESELILAPPLCMFRPPPGLEGMLVGSALDAALKALQLSSARGSSVRRREQRPQIKENSARQAIPHQSVIGEQRLQVRQMSTHYSPGQIFKEEVASATNERGACLNLTASISAPEDLGVLGVPSVGSAGHYLGLCKPCDFVNRGSCRLGIACQFCHLCGPGEAQRRRKERKNILNMVDNFQQGIAFSQRRARAP